MTVFDLRANVRSDMVDAYADSFLRMWTTAKPLT
jgi:hypothetical protein